MWPALWDLGAGYQYRAEGQWRALDKQVLREGGPCPAARSHPCRGRASRGWACLKDNVGCVTTFLSRPQGPETSDRGKEGGKVCTVAVSTEPHALRSMRVRTEDGNVVDESSHGVAGTEPERY